MPIFEKEDLKKSYINPETALDPTSLKVKSSQYDTGFILPDENTLNTLNNLRADRQGHWDSFANMLVRGAGKAVLTVPESIGYLFDLPEVIGAQREFDNVLSNWARSQKESLDESLPEYSRYTEEGGEFNPLDREFYWRGGDSVIESLGYLVPGFGVGGATARGLSLLGKLGGNVIKGASALTAATATNYIESMQVAGETYRDLISKGVDPEIAAKEAKDIIWQGKVNIALELPQYLTLFRGFNTSRAMKGADNSFVRFKAKDYGMQMGSEAVEELGLDFIAKDNERDALLQSKLIEDDGSNITQRFVDYATSDEGLTAGFLGALGGIAFQGGGDIINYTKDVINKDKTEGQLFSEATSQIKQNTELIKATLKENATIFQAQQEAIRNNDPVAFNSLQREAFKNLAFSNALKGTYSQFLDTLDSLSTMNQEEASKLGLNSQEVNELTQTFKKDAKVYENLFTQAEQLSNNPTIQQEGFNVLANKYLSDNTIANAQSQINKIYSENTSPTFGPTKQRVNRLVNQQEVFNRFINSITQTEGPRFEFKQFLQKKLSNINQQIQQEIENLNNYIDSEFTSDEYAKIRGKKLSEQDFKNSLVDTQIQQQEKNLVVSQFESLKAQEEFNNLSNPKVQEERIKQEEEVKVEEIKQAEKEAVENLSKKITDAGYNIKLNENLIETELDKQENKRNTATGVPVFYKGKLGFLRRVKDNKGNLKIQIVSGDGANVLDSVEKEEDIINLEKNTIVISLAEYRKYTAGIKQANLKEAQLKGLQRLVQEYSDKLTFYNPEQLDKAKQKREELYQELDKLKNLKPTSIMSKKDIDEEIWLVKELIKEVENEIYKLEQAKLDIENSWLYLSEILEEIKALPQDVYVPIKDIISSLNKALWERQEQIKQDFNEVVELEKLQEETTNQLESINNQLDALYKERIDLLDLLNAFEEIHDNNKGYSNLLRVLPESAEFRVKYFDSLRFFKPNEIRYVIDRKDPKVYKKFKAYVKFEANRRGISQREFLKQFNDDLKNTNKALLTAVEEQTHEDFWFITDNAINNITAKINSLENLAKELAQKQMNIEDKIITKLSDVSAGQTIAKKLADNAKYLQENYKALYNRSSNIYQAIRMQQSEQYKEIVQDQAEQPDENITLEEFTQQNFITDIIFGTTGVDTEYKIENGKYLTVYDESGNPVLNPNPDMQRWMNWINTIGPNNIMEKGKPLYKVKYVNALELSSILGRPVLDRNNNALGEDDLFVVVLDKDGNLVKHDKDIVFTSLFKPETITQSGRLNITKLKEEYLRDKKASGNLKTETIDGKNLYTITEGGVAQEFTDEEIENKIKETIKQQYTNFINNIKANKGKNITTPIIGVSNGIPLHNKSKSKTPIKKLGFKLGINSKVLVATAYNKEIVPGQLFRPGTILIQDTKTGAYIPAQTRNLLDNVNGNNEIETVLQLLNLANSGQALNTIELPLGKDDKGKDLFFAYSNLKLNSLKVFPNKKDVTPSLLEMILNYGVRDIKQAQNNKIGNQEIFIRLTDKTINFKFNNVPYSLPLSEVLNEEKNGDLKAFLAQKRTNLNNKVLLNNKGAYFHPVWDNKSKSFKFNRYYPGDGQSAYEKYLETIMETTALPQKNRLSNKKLQLSKGLNPPIITEEKPASPRPTEPDVEVIPYDEVMKLEDGNYEVKNKKGMTISFQMKDKQFTITKIVTSDNTELPASSIIATNNVFNSANVDSKKEVRNEDGSIKQLDSKKELLSGFLIPTLIEIVPSKKEIVQEPSVSLDSFFGLGESSLPVFDINSAIDKRIIENELANGDYSFYPTEEASEKNEGIVITKDNVNQAIAANKALGDVIYDTMSKRITGVPEPMIYVETYPGVSTEFFGAKDLQDFINNPKEDAKERELAKQEYDRLAVLEGTKPVNTTDTKATDDNFDDFALVEIGVLKTIKDYIKAGIIKQKC